MLWIYILLIIMGALSAVAWCLEAMPAIKQLLSLKVPKGNNPLKVASECVTYLVGFIKAIFLSWSVVADIVITGSLVSMFGAAGSIGGILIGLAISDVISVFILYIVNKVKEI